MRDRGNRITSYILPPTSLRPYFLPPYVLPPTSYIRGREGEKESNRKQKGGRDSKSRRE